MHIRPNHGDTGQCLTLGTRDEIQVKNKQREAARTDKKQDGGGCCPPQHAPSSLPLVRRRNEGYCSRLLAPSW